MKNKNKESHKSLRNLTSEKRHKLLRNLTSEACHKLLRNLRSQGLSLNMIIIAAIGLIVLVVLVAIFTGYAGNWSRSFGGTCDEQGGVCSTQGECNKADFTRKVFAKPCPYYVREWNSEKGEYGYKDSKDQKKAGQCCLPT